MAINLISSTICWKTSAH